MQLACEVKNHRPSPAPPNYPRSGKDSIMRGALRLLPVGLALLAGVLGCSRTTLNYTAGVCDCNPPAVESVLAPPRAPCPMGNCPMPPAGLYTHPYTGEGAGPGRQAPAETLQFPDSAPKLETVPAPKVILQK